MTEQLTPEQAMQICRNGGLVRDGGYSRGHWYAASYNELVLVEYGHARGRRTGLGEPKLPHPDYPPEIFARDYSPGKCILPGPEAKGLVMSAPPGMLWTCIVPWEEELAEWWDGSDMRAETTTKWSCRPYHNYEVRIRPQWLEQQQQRFNAGNFKPAWKEKEMDRITVNFDGMEFIRTDTDKFTVINATDRETWLHFNASTLRNFLDEHFPAPGFQIGDKVTGADALRALADGHWLKRDGCSPVAIINGNFQQWMNGQMHLWCGPSDDWPASTFTIVEDPRPKHRDLHLDDGYIRVYPDRIEVSTDDSPEMIWADEFTQIAAAMAELRGEGQ